VTVVTDDRLVALLPSFLPGQRWFGSKARTITTCVVEDRAHLGATDDCAVVIVGVSYTPGPAERYALLVSVRQDPGELPPIGPIPEASGGWLVEASADPGAIHALLRGFLDGGELATRRGGRLRYGDAGSAVAALSAWPPVKAVGAEQSNTSPRVGGALIFKLFRRLPRFAVSCRRWTGRRTGRRRSLREGAVAVINGVGVALTTAVAV
jgi:maltokinase